MFTLLSDKSHSIRPLLDKKRLDILFNFYIYMNLI